MKLTEQQFKDKLSNKANNININLNNDQLSKLYIYKELLIDWNNKINLTAITDDEEIIDKHIIDCLEVVKYINEGQKIIDVGTGAGLPGIVIAIYFEGRVKVTLFDALNKRIIFLQEVINKLNLNNVEAIHGRAEETSKEQQYRETYDIVISRAVARLNILMELTVPFVKVNGICLYMKAEKTEEEMLEVNKAVKELNIKYINTVKYNIKSSEQEFKRTIIIYLKENKTKEKYPRQYSKIKKNPL